MAYRSYYRFNGDCNDAMGAYPVTPGGLYTYSVGKFSQSFETSVSGTTAHGYANIASDLGITTYNYTYSLWYKHKTPASPTGNYIFCHMNKTLGIAVNIQMYTAAIYANFEGVTSGGGSGWLPISPSTTDFWHYCLINNGAATASTSSLMLFVNGRKFSTYCVNGGAYGSLAANFNVSGYQTDNPRRAFVQGYFDEFIVENRAWSESEVHNYYNQGLGRYAPKIRNY